MRTRQGDKVKRFELRLTAEDRLRLRALAEASRCEESDLVRMILRRVTVAEGRLAVLADSGPLKETAALVA